MKTFTLPQLLFATSLVAFAAGANAADGEINFNGSVDTSTCSITVGGTSGGTPGEAFIGKVSKNALKKTGDIAGGGHFSLQIDDSDASCDIQDKAATVTFIGLTGSAGPNGQWLAVERTAGSATNVAIQIRDARGDEIRLNEASAEYVQLDQPLAFSANYIATGEATAGPAKGKASFSVDIH